MKKIINEKNAFTLIEVILVIAIIGIISSAIYLSYFETIRVWAFNQDRIEVQQDQDLINRWLERYTRQARSVDDSVSEQLTIEYPNSNTIVFYLNSDNLFSIIINGGKERIISQLKFKSLNFDFDNDLIEMKTEINNSKGTNTYQFNNLYYPRLLD
ncbi:MAG: prepilin-type N-terminal cleavage/methylation domain-containing protein [Halanaerobiales bacterium]